MLLQLQHTNMWSNRILQQQGLTSSESPNSAPKLNNSRPQPTLNWQERRQEVKETNEEGELKGK